MAPKLPCITCQQRPKQFGKNRCTWCWLKKQPAEVQVREARLRRKDAERRLEYVERQRVPAAQWPEGTRWCSGCQSFIPFDYIRGSQCMGHASESAHRSHVERTYRISSEEWEALLRWQGGRCAICGRRAISRRLATDHDHRTGEVRGLLCADDERGCNHALLGLLESSGVDPLASARRLVAYLEMSPLERMRAGQPGVPRETRQDQLRRAVLGAPQ